MAAKKKKTNRKSKVSDQNLKDFQRSGTVANPVTSSQRERSFSMSRMNQTGEAQSTTGAVRDSATQAAQSVRNLGENVRDAASEKFEQLRQQANDYYEQGRERAREWEQGLEQYVQEKPIQSLLIAAGVGMFLGLLWRRR